MLTERALESFKQFVETNIAYAMVEYGGTMHKAKILTRERLKDGRVALSISITPEASGTKQLRKFSCTIRLVSCGRKRAKQSS